MSRTETLPPTLRAVPDAEAVNPLRCYSYEEVAALIGMGETFVREAVASGRLTAVRFGGDRNGRNARIRIEHDELARFIREHRDPRSA